MPQMSPTTRVHYEHIGQYVRHVQKKVPKMFALTCGQLEGLVVIDCCCCCSRKHRVLRTRVLGLHSVAAADNGGPRSRLALYQLPLESLRPQLNDNVVRGHADVADDEQDEEEIGQELGHLCFGEAGGQKYACWRT